MPRLFDFCLKVRQRLERWADQPKDWPLLTKVLTDELEKSLDQEGRLHQNQNRLTALLLLTEAACRDGRLSDARCRRSVQVAVSKQLNLIRRLNPEVIAEAQKEVQVMTEEARRNVSQQN